MRFEFSCHGCKKRAAGCHGYCETYKEEKALYDAKKAAIDKQKEIKAGIYGQRYKSVVKATKRRGHGHG